MPSWHDLERERSEHLQDAFRLGAEERIFGSQRGAGRSFRREQEMKGHRHVVRCPYCRVLLRFSGQGKQGAIKCGQCKQWVGVRTPEYGSMVGCDDNGDIRGYYETFAMKEVNLSRLPGVTATIDGRDCLRREDDGDTDVRAEAHGPAGMWCRFCRVHHRRG